MNDTPTPLCDALEDRLQHDSEASRDYELLCFSDLARDLERQLAEATAALQWAQAQLGKHSRPSPIDKALAGIKQPLPNPPTEKP